VEKIVFNGEEYEVVDEMKNNQYNTLPKQTKDPWRSPYKREERVTFGLIVKCLLGCVAWAVFVWALINFMS
tara:strand:+ start:1124 stop:1336 length:213 start_codon:yes stop_codon:yes gene_type:complete